MDHLCDGGGDEGDGVPSVKETRNTGRAQARESIFRFHLDLLTFEAPPEKLSFQGGREGNKQPRPLLDVAQNEGQSPQSSLLDCVSCAPFFPLVSLPKLSPSLQGRLNTLPQLTHHPNHRLRRLNHYSLLLLRAVDDVNEEVLFD